MLCLARGSTWLLRCAFHLSRTTSSHRPLHSRNAVGFKGPYLWFFSMLSCYMLAKDLNDYTTCKNFVALNSALCIHTCTSWQLFSSLVSQFWWGCVNCSLYLCCVLKDALVPSYQLKAVWPFSSNLWHQQSVFIHRFSLFWTIICKPQRRLCGKTLYFPFWCSHSDFLLLSQTCLPFCSRLIWYYQ